MHERIAKLLNRMGKSQGWLAGEVGVSQATVNAWLKGGTKIPAEAAVKMAKVFGVSLEYLCTGGESQKFAASDIELEKIAPIADSLLEMLEIIAEDDPEYFASFERELYALSHKLMRRRHLSKTDRN